MPNVVTRLLILTEQFSLFRGFIASFLSPQTWLLYVLSAILGIAAAGLCHILQNNCHSTIQYCQLLATSSVDKQGMTVA